MLKKLIATVQTGIYEVEEFGTGLADAGIYTSKRQYGQLCQVLNYFGEDEVLGLEVSQEIYELLDNTYGIKGL